MTPGSRIRRTAPGSAVLMIAAMAGCHAVPLARIAPAPNRPQSALATAGRAALFPATVAMDPPAEMASIEPVVDPSTTESSARLAGTSKPIASPPTPLLDAALVRAQGFDDLVAGEMARPSTPPPSTPTPPPPAVAPTPPEPRPEPVAVAVAVATPPVTPAEPPRPEELWREGIRQMASLARAKLEQPGGAASPWGLRARILAWMAEPDIDPDIGQHENDGVRAVLRALDDSPVETPARGDEVRSAVLALEEKAPLEIVDLRLCSKVERFGDFEPFDPPVRKAGQPVVIYCEVDGLRYEPTSAGFRTRLSALVEIVPAGGGPAIQLPPPGTADETCRRRRRDYFVAYKLVLPRSLAPGDYKIRLTEKDLTADRSATREVGFTIARE